MIRGNSISLPNLVAFQLDEQVVSDELDVLGHEATVHPNHVHGQGLCQECLRFKIRSMKTIIPKTCSILTASLMISWILSCDSLLFKCEYIRQAKSRCRPSSLQRQKLIYYFPKEKARFSTISSYFALIRMNDWSMQILPA